MTVRKLLLKVDVSLIIFCFISLFSFFFLCAVTDATTQDFQNDPEACGDQERKKILSRYCVTSGDLPGAPNFYLSNSPTGPQDPLLVDILTFFPHINEILLCDTLAPTQALVSLVQTPNHLKSLRMGGATQGIAPEGMQSLACLIVQKGLLILRLTDMPEFGPENIGVLAKALSQTASLTSLTLQFQEKCGPQGAHFLAKGLQNQNSLTRLVLSNCKLGNVGASKILNALGQNGCLRTLTLHDYIDEDSDPFVVTSFHKNTTLTRLCLNGYCDSPETLTALSAGLKDNTSLTCLSIAGPFSFPSQSAQNLGVLIAGHPSIKNLKVLSYNLYIHPFVQHAIEGGLEKLRWSYARDQMDFLPLLLGISSLKKLSLPYNGLQDQNMGCFCLSLRSCSNLTKLTLKNNRATETGENALKQTAQTVHPGLIVKFFQC